VIISLVGSYRSYFNDPEKPQERFHSLARHATQKIAIIDVSGAIMEGDGFVKRQIDAVAEDSNVVAVVLRVNSPGGTVTGSDFIYHHLCQLLEKRKLPMVVSMGSLCASGGYYVAMAVGDRPDALYAEPMTITGSIGVIMPHYDLSGLLGLWSVKDDSIATGPLKQMGSPTKPMTPEDRKALEAILADMFTGFKAVVMNGRPKFKADPAALDAVATGQVFTAKQAQAAGLIDRLGYLDDAVKQAAKLARIDDLTTVRAVVYSRPKGLFDDAFGGLLGQSSGEAAQQRTLSPTDLFSFATPRAYYLWSLGPTLFQSGN
jgi:protease IV